MYVAPASSVPVEWPRDGASRTLAARVWALSQFPHRALALVCQLIPARA
jgi:hypothetical protein